MLLLALYLVDTFDYRLLLLTSLRYFVHSAALFLTVWLNYLTLCKVVGLGLEVQSLCLGLDQKGLGLVLGNFWSLGLGLEEKVLFTSLL